MGQERDAPRRVLTEGAILDLGRLYSASWSSLTVINFRRDITGKSCDGNRTVM